MNRNKGEISHKGRGLRSVYSFASNKKLVIYQSMHFHHGLIRKGLIHHCHLTLKEAWVIHLILEKGKIFEPNPNPQVAVMVTGARKEVSANTLSPCRSWLRAFNSTSTMIISQLAASAKTPSRKVPVARRSLRTSLVMFHNETTPHSTPRPITAINVTSESQPFETEATTLGGASDSPIDPMEGRENVDVRNYHSVSKGEHTKTADWQARIRR